MKGRKIFCIYLCQIPPRCWFGYFPYGMGRQECLWPEAKSFKPERWLADGFVRPSPFVYPVFNAGPRTCLGQNMAYLEMKLALTTLYHNFRFRLVRILFLFFSANSRVFIRFVQRLVMYKIIFYVPLFFRYPVIKLRI